MRIALLALLALCANAAVAADYRNPILFADYSDPDVIRVGDRYYMTASSFHFSPGLPVLESRDLVHWTLIGHALPKLTFDPKYDLPGPLGFSDGSERARFLAEMGHRYSSGVWAPSIRHHEGLFYIYFPTPTEGIFMVAARNPAGPWSAPVAVMAEPRLEDPCPFWDDDGQAYLIHGRVSAGPLVLHRMSADGTKVLDAGKVIVEDPEKLPVLEGPKLLKRHGWYYIFAPYGGVEQGPQAVLRSRNIWGPYDMRTVLTQGSSPVQAPHQGGYVETPRGEGWFLHFNSTGAYGRILYLEPVRWVDDWPEMGIQPVFGGDSQPVMSHAMPDVGKTPPPMALQDSDEFASQKLGLQWEWNHNPLDDHWSLAVRPGFLRLTATRASDLVLARNTLTQILVGPSMRVTTRLELDGLRDGQRAGLAVLQVQPNWIGVVQTAGARRITWSSAGAQLAGPAITGSQVQLRMSIADETVAYEYSTDDGASFQPLGTGAKLRFSWWKGARPALFSFTTADGDAGHADFDWVRVTH
ncbi:MAG TPA: glycoside hydrolase 43 family protein [Steroidobacteraceae bacterium]|nr:glycoside hydrolase 43 family protein [Steroidobacteraceae bacterium]